MKAACREGATQELLARILTSWVFGDTVLPQWLGLGVFEFRRMIQHHFPALSPNDLIGPEDFPKEGEYGDERADLRKLILKHRSHRSDSEVWFAEILICGCMGQDHLWQDLGLWSRNDLSRLITLHFEPLAKSNIKNMKWKKFLYKQLCETEGVYTCRSPSCEVCSDYNNCFGSRE
jgi:nitrogen fixation protein NifQ